LLRVKQNRDDFLYLPLSHLTDVDIVEDQCRKITFFTESFKQDGILFQKETPELWQGVTIHSDFKELPIYAPTQWSSNGYHLAHKWRNF